MNAFDEIDKLNGNQKIEKVVHRIINDNKLRKEVYFLHIQILRSVQDCVSGIKYYFRTHRSEQAGLSYLQYASRPPPPIYLGYNIIGRALVS